MVAHLATTALQELWGPAERRVFVSEWCLRMLSADERRQLMGEIAPNPWDEPGRRESAMAYVDACYEKVLAQLTRRLETIHGVSCTARYWRILLGPWLLHFLHATYDRFVHLSDALTRYPDATIDIVSEQQFEIPISTGEFVRGLRTDQLNAQIFAQIWRALGRSGRVCRIPTVAYARPSRHTARRSSGRQIQGVIRDAVCRVARSRGSVMLDMGLSQADACWLRFWSGGCAFPGNVARLTIWTFPIPPNPNPSLRHALDDLGDESPFGRVVRALLPRHLPLVFLEAYQPAVADVLRQTRCVPKAIVSSTGWYYQEAFKIFAATRALSGTRLVAVQHGAGYGIALRHPSEAHERHIADDFFTWGWSDSSAIGRAKLTNAPSVKLSTRLGRRPRYSNDILYVTTAAIFDQYAQLLESRPLAGQWEAYILSQIQFLEALPLALFARVRLRGFPDRGERPLHERLRTRFPGLRFDESPTFEDALATCGLVVVDHPGTAFLEACASRVPVVAFWNDAHWRVRPDAARYLENLRTAGILMGGPRDASLTVAKLLRCPSGEQKVHSLTSARRQFVERFALSDQDWRRTWGRLARNLARDEQAPAICATLQ